MNILYRASFPRQTALAFGISSSLYIARHYSHGWTPFFSQPRMVVFLLVLTKNFLAVCNRSPLFLFGLGLKSQRELEFSYPTKEITRIYSISEVELIHQHFMWVKTFFSMAYRLFSFLCPLSSTLDIFIENPFLVASHYSVQKKIHPWDVTAKQVTH